MDETYHKIYYEKNKEKIKANVKRHRKNPEYRKKQQEWNDKWRSKPENREKILVMRRRSQSKIHAILRKVGYVTPEIRAQILLRDNYRCLACGAIKSLTIDHIKSISKGGTTQEKNLQTLCRSCNSRKQQKTISYKSNYD